MGKAQRPLCHRLTSSRLVSGITWGLVAGVALFSVVQSYAKAQISRAISSYAIEVVNPQTSVQGRSIPIYRFGTGQTEQVFLFAGFHGNEPQGPYILDKILEQLVANDGYYTDKSVFVIPRVNPDALVSKRRTNAHGVDLNRNFPTRNFVPHRAKGTPYYGGPKALSEPESQIVHTLLSPAFETSASAPQRPQPRIRILTIHAPYAVNNYDGPAKALAERMQTHNAYPAKADIGYPTPGSFGTYYGKERGIQVITLETGNYAPSTAWSKHKDAVLAFLQFPDTNLYPQPQPTRVPEVEPTSQPTATPLPEASPGATPHSTGTVLPTGRKPRF